MMFPTAFEGYWITKDGRVYREHNKFFEGKNYCKGARIEVSQFFRGGAGNSNKQYPSVNISLRDSEGKTIRQIKKYVHRLIAETFIDNPHNYTEVDHLDRNKLNNCVDNLRWCDVKTNRQNRGICKNKP